MQILSGRRHGVRELAFSQCGRWLAAGGHAGGVHVWDTLDPTAKPRQPKRAEWAKPPAVFNLAFCPDGRLLFESPPDWFLYDPAAGELTELGFRPGLNVRVSPNGLRAAAVNVDGLRTWAIPVDGLPRAELTEPEPFVVRAAFSRDGAALATVQFRDRRQELVVRDASTGQERHTFGAGAFFSLAFSAGGEYLFAWAGQSLVCWNLADPKQSQAVDDRVTKPFLSVAPHPVGPLLTVDSARLVRVWDVPSLIVSRTIEWNVGKLHAVAVSPDGARAAVGSHTGKVLVWD